MTGLRSAGVCGGSGSRGGIMNKNNNNNRWQIVIIMEEAYSLSSLSSLSKAWLEKSSSIFSPP